MVPTDEFGIDLQVIVGRAPHGRLAAENVHDLAVAFATYEAADASDRLSARPDFAALIYPVITLEPPYDHTSTRRMLIGNHPSAAMRAEWSVEEHVRARCPPMFLVQAEDDPISDPHNTLIMQAACERAGIPVELHRLADGGHGFGMGRPGTASADSTTRVLEKEITPSSMTTACPTADIVRLFFILTSPARPRSPGRRAGNRRRTSGP